MPPLQCRYWTGLFSPRVWFSQKVPMTENTTKKDDKDKRGWRHFRFEDGSTDRFCLWHERASPPASPPLPMFPRVQFVIVWGPKLINQTRTPMYRKSILCLTKKLFYVCVGIENSLLRMYMQRQPRCAAIVVRSLEGKNESRDNIIKEHAVRSVTLGGMDGWSNKRGEQSSRD